MGRPTFSCGLSPTIPWCSRGLGIRWWDRAGCGEGSAPRVVTASVLVFFYFVGFSRRRGDGGQHVRYAEDSAERR